MPSEPFDSDEFREIEGGDVFGSFVNPPVTLGNSARYGEYQCDCCSRNSTKSWLNNGASQTCMFEKCV